MDATANANNSSINWQDKYIDKLASDMESLKGMEGRIMSYIARLETRMDTMYAKRGEEIRELKTSIELNNKHNQNLVTAAIVGIGATTAGMLAIIATIIVAVVNIFYK